MLCFSHHNMLLIFCEILIKISCIRKINSLSTGTSVERNNMNAHSPRENYPIHIIYIKPAHQFAQKLQSNGRILKSVFGIFPLVRNLEI